MSSLAILAASLFKISRGNRQINSQTPLKTAPKRLPSAAVITNDELYSPQMVVKIYECTIENDLTKKREK